MGAVPNKVRRPLSPNRTYACSRCGAPYLLRSQVQIPNPDKPRTIVCDECVHDADERTKGR